jgi:hypothetical protein
LKKALEILGAKPAQAQAAAAAGKPLPKGA